MKPAKVLVELCEEGLNNKNAWPAEILKPTEKFEAAAFGLDALPHKYVDDGVRGARPSPFLLRASASVHFPAGKHRLLIRARSASRLTVDGRIIAETPFPPDINEDGSEANPQRLVPLDLGPGYRWVPAGEFEQMAEFETAGGALAVTFEVFVGGRKGAKAEQERRTELGETVVAVSWAGTSAWELLTPATERVPYTDAGWEKHSAQLAAQIEALDAAKRAERRRVADDFWKKRRQAAAQWLANTHETPVPAAPDGATASNPIDNFLAAKLSAVASQNRHAAPNAVDYFKEIRPLLDRACTECHSGAKAKAGLKLDSFASATRGGDSGPALIPGDPVKSELLRRIASTDPDEQMPPKGGRFSAAEVALVERWIKEGAVWPELPLARREPTPPADELTFLRRAMLDTVGVPPTADEARAFAANPAPDKRAKLVDKLLADPRWADHWMGFWQDLLAENPNILNPTLNNTGPFRWWIYDAMRDDLPLDRMVTQLARQSGSPGDGGPAGFAYATQNDAPYAAKGTIVSAAFLGVEMKCARCHDSPTGTVRQEQLFNLGAMLATKPIDVPATSSVDPAKLAAGGRKPLIQVTLKPGSKVEPRWPFEGAAGFPASAIAATLAQRPADTRDQIAALLTAPQNERFAQVIANRVWQRFMGRGIVEPLDNWEKGTPTHPELLRWLGREFVRGGYSLKGLARLILNSRAYQRATDPALREPDPLHTAPAPHRLSAEQVVDGLFAATGKPMRTERVCLDINGRRETGNALDLGRPRRAWMLASLSNERDRPSLTLPRLAAVADVMSALGWRGARQDPISVRETAPNSLQPAILANGVMSGWLTRLSDDHGLTAVALAAKSPEELVDALFLQLLTRRPTPEEMERHAGHLREGFARRVIADANPVPQPHHAPKLVTWSNHLTPEATTARQAEEAAARAGDPPTPRLQAAWRLRCEDVIWALINSPEQLFRP